MRLPQRIGCYQVTAKIGEGGMGEVYQARDTKLDRDVALKVLPAAFTSDRDRLARFEREARVLASLNHPNIAAIHGFEEADGIKALVLELVEGPTLADRIAQGAIPVEEALAIADQIAEALEAAHEAGVIHRDLKPANIKVREDGTVKVLDFGLAKALDRTLEGDPSQSPTLTATATQMGVILGTAAYMSPEQARGKPVDKRADIWAFGAVLFEMLSGVRPFPGDDVSHTLARVIERDPDWEALPATLPATIGAFLRQCLQKESRVRVRDIGDVRLALSGAFDTGIVAAAGPNVDSRPPSPWQRAVPWVAAVALAVGAAGLTRWLVPTAVTPRVVQFDVAGVPPGSAGVPAFNAALSPDGRYAVYRSATALVVRRLDQRTEVALPDTVSGYGPFVSADSADVGFFVSDRGRGNRSSVYRVPIEGGPPVQIAEIPGSAIGASWGSDDTVVVGTGLSSGLWQVPASGGDAVPLTQVDDPNVNHGWPHFLPGGRALLFTIMDLASGGQQVALLDLDTGEHSVLLSAATSARYLTTGHLLYAANGALHVVPFDLERKAVSGEPVAVLEGVVTMTSGAGPYAIADNGTLLYLESGDVARPDEYQLSWVDQAGNVERIPVAPGPYRSLSLSPDGTRVALEMGQRRDTDLWVADLATGVITRLTFAPGAEASPLWTPDGERIVYTGRGGLFRKAADGTGSPERLGRAVSPASWADDGRTLVFVRRTPETLNDIGVLSLEDGVGRLLFDGPAMEAQPEVSPDGRWLPYLSNESSLMGLFVRPMPNVSDGLWQLTEVGVSPVWAPDGTAVFYVRLSGGNPTMMRIPVTTEPTFTQGTPEALFEASAFLDPSTMSAAGVSPRRMFELAPDGRFLTATRVGSSSEPLDLVVVVNWFEELKRLVPAR